MVLAWAKGVERIACVADVPNTPLSTKHGVVRIFDLSPSSETLAMSVLEGFCTDDSNAPVGAGTCAAAQPKYNYGTSRAAVARYGAILDFVNSHLGQNIFIELVYDGIAAHRAPNELSASYQLLASSCELRSVSDREISGSSPFPLDPSREGSYRFPIMLKFSQDGPTADKQMRAVIFYLTTFGYIDGDFDDAERAFVRSYVRKLIEHRVREAVPESDQKLRAELVAKFTTHFHEVFEGIQRQVKDLFTEAVAEGEAQNTFVHSKLKLRCFEIFKGFDAANQEQLLTTIDELIHADGQVHPAELKFRGELAQLLEEELGVELLEDEHDPRTSAVASDEQLVPSLENHPFFQQFEYHYTSDPARLHKQVDSDRKLIDRVLARLSQQRAAGAGKLVGKRNVAEFQGTEPFLDGHVHVLSPLPRREYELIVVGDLHGCYSCLKAVLMQSNFFAKVNKFVDDPEHTPEPKLILLGDYIDRGMFSYQGVLRSAMQLFLRAPDHVYLLRGNHEYYIEHQGRVLGAVRPSEAMDTLKPHLSQEVFAHYMQLFDALPNMLFFERLLFVHGGIARDLLLKQKYKDLSSLNDWDIRFQMMWSDPSSADVIPAALQEQSSRFPFGRLQSQAFLQRVGCHTLVRGHEKVNEGFRRVYDDPNQLLITLFSAGGSDNKDIPADSSYRSVTPMAMTVKYKDHKSQIIPWAIDYRRYNSPDTNKFFESPPEIEHLAG